MENKNDDKKFWCCVTYFFPADSMPPLPAPMQAQISLPVQPQPPAVGFEPTWFFNQKFPEDE